MRTIILLLLTASFFQLQAQAPIESKAEKPSKHSIGLSLEYNGYVGLFFSGDYYYSFADRWTMYSGITANVAGSVGARVGITYNILDYKYFKLRTGLGVFGYHYNDLKYNDRDLTDWPILWELELPILLDVPLSEKFSIHTGVILRTPLNKPTSINGFSPVSEGMWGKLKLGAKYKF